MRKLKQLALLGLIILAGSCGVPTSDPSGYPVVAPTPMIVDTMSKDTIVMDGDDYQEDTTALTITNTYLKVSNPLFNTEAYENVKRIVIEFEEGNISFMKVNNIVLYSNADKVVTHQYKYTSANTILIQEGNTLQGIAADHNTTEAELRKLNPQVGKILRLGKTLRIK